MFLIKGLFLDKYMLAKYSVTCVSIHMPVLKENLKVRKRILVPDYKNTIITIISEKMDVLHFEIKAFRCTCRRCLFHAETVVHIQFQLHRI